MQSSKLKTSLLALGVALPLATGAALAQTPPAATPAAPTASAAPADPAKVIARVNGLTITEGDLAVAAADPALQLPNVPEAQKRDLLTGYLIDLKLGAKAAEAAKVGDSADFARKLAYNRDKTLLDQYLEQEARKAVTPEAARKLYDETAKGVTPEQEVRARHILVASEDDAKKAQARVKGGEDFAKVAGELSTDPGSKTDGGDLGFFTKDRMVEPFAEAAFKMEPGQISDPVQSQFGWHVIKVEEKRNKPVPSFDEMQEQVNTYLERKAQQDLILGLRQSAKIERLDDKGNLVEQKKQ
ncbi:peptidylprolyl isomerase [Microvirga aerophila]|uniref:Parvulin-like PPIase n=1 Tax=Microvirga aerophila TaxID=670291 RepID=A0A512BL92_9HYPH|nr:peptidylprolyl isomerase [Microvirga aerophila]GEO12734.1 peptidylprolyl isomerase [Microvirga aerophila]